MPHRSGPREKRASGEACPRNEERGGFRKGGVSGSPVERTGIRGETSGPRQKRRLGKRDAEVESGGPGVRGGRREGRPEESAEPRCLGFM